MGPLKILWFVAKIWVGPKKDCTFIMNLGTQCVWHTNRDRLIYVRRHLLSTDKSNPFESALKSHH